MQATSQERGTILTDDTTQKNPCSEQFIDNFFFSILYSPPEVLNGKEQKKSSKYQNPTQNDFIFF